MKLRILASIILAAMALTLILAGPRPNAHVSLNPPLLPDNLDEFLPGSESRFTDLIADTNKNIVWHDPLNHSKTNLAIVYLHGFSATRQEVKPLPVTQHSMYWPVTSCRRKLPDLLRTPRSDFYFDNEK